MKRVMLLLMVLLVLPSASAIIFDATDTLSQGEKKQYSFDGKAFDIEISEINYAQESSVFIKINSIPSKELKRGYYFSTADLKFVVTGFSQEKVDFGLDYLPNNNYVESASSVEDVIAEGQSKDYSVLGARFSITNMVVLGNEAEFDLDNNKILAKQGDKEIITGNIILEIIEVNQGKDLITDNVKVKIREKGLLERFIDFIKRINIF